MLIGPPHMNLIHLWLQLNFIFSLCSVMQPDPSFQRSEVIFSRDMAINIYHFIGWCCWDRNKVCHWGGIFFHVDDNAVIEGKENKKSKSSSLETKWLSKHEMFCLMVMFFALYLFLTCTYIIYELMFAVFRRDILIL